MENRCFVFNRNSVDENTLSEAEKIDRFDEIGETQQDLCPDLPTYKHTDGKYYCILHLPKKDKNVDEFRKVITRILIKVDSKITEIEKLSEDKQQVEKNKLKYDFRYVWFPCPFSLRSKSVKVEANFKSATFCEHADFQKAVFLGYANFGYVSFCASSNFKFAKFSADAYFYDSKFPGNADFKYTFFSNGKFTKSVFSENADFESSEFVRHANFIETTFVKEANFKNSKLFIADFENAKFFNTANFKSVEFLNSAFFKGNNGNLVFGNKAILDLQYARIEKPERISFYRVRLCPSWFVNIDSRKLTFTDVSWDNLDGHIGNDFIHAELNNLEKRSISEPKPLLILACRQLAVNAEENSRFEESSKFRFMAFATERLERIGNRKTWWKRVITTFSDKYKLTEKLKRLSNLLKTAPYDFIHFLYRWLSGYGESWFWAFFVLSLIFGVSIIFYISPLCVFGNKDEHITGLSIGEAILYSLRVMFLQRPDPQPFNNFAKVIITLESIFASVQVALLALAIRRKFMR